MKKKLTSIILSVFIFTTVFAVPTVGFATEQEVGTEQRIAVAAAAENIVPYAVEGGNIYFDKSTGTITKSDKEITSAIIPEKINGVTVTSIGAEAFESREFLTSIKLPESITKIGNHTFYMCTSLAEINLPNNITKIGHYAFSATAITEITIPNTLACIEEGMFSNTDLSHIILPDSITTIEEAAFFGCNKLTSVTISKNIIQIGDYAFYCKALTEFLVDIDNTQYTSVGGVLFTKDRKELVIYPTGKEDSNYSVPSGVISIARSAFYYEESLEKIEIPNSVTSIGGHAFQGCKSLVDLNLPRGITSIEDSVFSGCSSLSGVIIPDSVEIIKDQAFWDCTKIKKLVVPNSVTTIGGRAFSGCSSLEKIELSSKLTTIEGGIFYGCTALKSLEIPNGVTKITGDAFFQCKALETIIIPKSVMAMDVGLFRTTSTDTLTIYGYAGSYAESYAKENNIPFKAIDGKEDSTAVSKSNQTISGTSSFTKTYGDKAFRLGAKTNGDGKLTYKSSDIKVATIDRKGKVTIKGTGKATISITAAATADYNSATKKVTITVKPKKVASLKIKKGKKRMLVSWKKDSKATGYQVTYAQNKKFTQSKKDITIGKNKTVKKTIKKLKPKKTYYVKVRAYKKVGNTKIYGAYSSVKTAKVK